MKKLTKSISAVALSLGGLILGDSTQAASFGDMMDPFKWMSGGNRERYSDYGGGYGGSGYGYGAPGGWGGGSGYGYGGPGDYK